MCRSGASQRSREVPAGTHAAAAARARAGGIGAPSSLPAATRVGGPLPAPSQPARRALTQPTGSMIFLQASQGGHSRGACNESRAPRRAQLAAGTRGPPPSPSPCHPPWRACFWGCPEQLTHTASAALKPCFAHRRRPTCCRGPFRSPRAASARPCRPCRTWQTSPQTAGQPTGCKESWLIASAPCGPQRGGVALARAAVEDGRCPTCRPPAPCPLGHAPARLLRHKAAFCVVRLAVGAVLAAVDVGHLAAGRAGGWRGVGCRWCRWYRHCGEEAHWEASSGAQPARGLMHACNQPQAQSSHPPGCGRLGRGSTPSGSTTACSQEGRPRRQGWAATPCCARRACTPALSCWVSQLLGHSRRTSRE